MIETFILFLSGFKKGVIDHCEMDKFHATIIGAILLIVGIYATSAWCFFFQTVWSEWYIYLPAGLLLGSFIVCFDRALIASMATASNNKLGGITFRFILAILLGIFLSQPMMLKFFQSDVEIEARALRSEEDSLFQKKLESSYLIKLTPLQTELERLRSEIKESETIYNNAVQGHTGEVQGTSGSGQSGVAKVAKETKETRDKREAELKEKKEELNPEIKKLVSQIDSIYKAKNSDLEKHKEENTISGTLIQAKALKSLITKDESGILYFRYILLSIILTLIELSALIAKLFLSTKSYQSRVSMIMNIEVKNSNISEGLSIGTYDKIKTQLETSFEEKINDFFTKADPIVKNKLDEMIKCWQTNQDLPQSMSLRDLCQAFVDNLLIQSVKLPDNGGEGSKTKDIFDNTFNSFFVRTSILVAIAYGFFKLINKIAPVQPDILNIISNFIYLVAVIISLYTTFSNKKNQSKI